MIQLPIGNSTKLQDRVSKYNTLTDPRLSNCIHV